MAAYFVTGVGTGVGKTFTTCALMHAKQARGLKPVISGWKADDALSDTAQIIAASGGRQTLEETSPWRFSAPLSPHRAAALENAAIDVERLLAWIQAEAAKPGLTLIEGVGGVMAPLSDSFTALDWMAAAGLPVILVTGSYLGSISHTLTALLALRARGLFVQALVMNESDGSTVTLAEAQAGLAPFISDIPWRIVQPLVSSWKLAKAIQGMEIA